DGGGAGDAGDAGVRAPLPRGLTGFRVEGTKVPVVGSAGEDEPAPRGQDWTPVVWLERTHPHFLTGVHVPGLDLADVLRAVRDDHPDVLDLGAQPELALLVGVRRAQERAAEVLVGRDVQISGLRIVGGRRPVLAAPQRRTEGDLLTRDRLLRLVVLGAARSRVELREHRLLDVGLGVDEADAVGLPLQHPQVSVAARVYQALDRPSAALDVHQDRSRHLVPVPRVVPVVLVKRAQLACVGVQRDHRGRVEIVAGALIAHPLRPVAGAPVREIELGIEAARDPDGRATRLPRIALPGLGARLARRRYRERLPGRGARAGLQRLDETADPELTARDADHD